jgi:Bifunctional DNA primase/polymerase, N-terminal
VPTSSSSYPQSPQDAALIYVSLGWPIFPCASNKRPLVAGGFKSATRDPKQIIEWWNRWRHAEPAVALPASYLLVDLDRKGGKDAFRGFERLAGFPVDQFASPQATTPSGGRHVFCSTEGRTFRNTVRIGGTAIDLRTVGGYALLPSLCNGRSWLPGKSRTFASVPDWLLALSAADPPRPVLQAPFAPVDSYSGPSSRYGSATLRAICADIRSAANGHQEVTLNSGAYKVGRLIADRQLGEDAANQLMEAALAMRNYDPGRPWTRTLVENKIHRAIGHGKAQRL